jgi:Co/Zn/Cd efflux system component
VSLGVVASALGVALGFELADPIIGLAITLVILKITWDSWRTVRSAEIDLDHIDGNSDHHEHGSNERGACPLRRVGRASVLDRAR